jgi:hypothetical protein
VSIHIIIADERLLLTHLLSPFTWVRSGSPGTGTHALLDHCTFGSSRRASSLYYSLYHAPFLNSTLTYPEVALEANKFMSFFCRQSDRRATENHSLSQIFSSLRPAGSHSSLPTYQNLFYYKKHNICNRFSDILCIFACRPAFTTCFDTLFSLFFTKMIYFAIILEQKGEMSIFMSLIWTPISPVNVAVPKDWTSLTACKIHTKFT